MLPVLSGAIMTGVRVRSRLHNLRRSNAVSLEGSDCRAQSLMEVESAAETKAFGPPSSEKGTFAVQFTSWLHNCFL